MCLPLARPAGPLPGKGYQNGWNIWRDGGEKASPLARATLWLSLTAGFAISFVSTPKLYALSVDWAVTSADLGPFLTWVGSVVWFLVVAALTMFVSNLALLMTIMLAGFLVTLLMTRLRH